MARTTRSATNDTLASSDTRLGTTCYVLMTHRVVRTSSSTVSVRHPRARPRSPAAPSGALHTASQHSGTDYTSRLPAEVLCCIFRFARLANGLPTPDDLCEAQFERQMQEMPQLDMTQFALAWITLTYVCSRWRALALNDATLWTDIPRTLGVAWAHKFLERSGEQAISIDWSYTWHPEAKKTQDLNMNSEFKGSIVQAHYFRLRRFRSFVDQDDLTLETLSRSWPILEELNITLSENVRTVTLLAGHAPRLRHLGFRAETPANACTDFPWNAPFMNALRVLDLRFSQGIHGASMVAFLDALDRMPGLRHLRLNSNSIVSSQLPNDCAYCHTASARVQDVPLETLAVHWPQRMASHLIDHIRPPPACRLSFFATEHFEYNAETKEYEPEGIVSNLCIKIREWRDRSDIDGSPPALPYVALRLYFPWGSQMRIHLSSSPVFPSLLEHDQWYKGINGAHPDLDISCGLNLNIDDHARYRLVVLVNILKILVPDNNIQMLSISDNIELCSEDLRPGFIRDFLDPVFDNVVMLHLPSPSLGEFCWLAGDTVQRHCLDEKLTILPGLRALDLARCSLAHYDLSSKLTQMQNMLRKRRNVSVYLRVSDELENLRNGRIQDTSFGRHRNHKKAGAMVKTLDAMAAFPGVKFVGSDANVSYATVLEQLRDDSGEIEAEEMGSPEGPGGDGSESGSENESGSVVKVEWESPRLLPLAL